MASTRPACPGPSKPRAGTAPSSCWLPDEEGGFVSGKASPSQDMMYRWKVIRDWIARSLSFQWSSTGMRTLKLRKPAGVEAERLVCSAAPFLGRFRVSSDDWMDKLSSSTWVKLKESNNRLHGLVLDRNRLFLPFVLCKWSGSSSLSLNRLRHSSNSDSGNNRHSSVSEVTSGNSIARSVVFASTSAS